MRLKRTASSDGRVVVLLLTLAAALTFAAVQLPPPSERLWLATLEVHGIDDIYNQEIGRLSALCLGSTPGCWSRNFKTVPPMRVGVMYSEPSAKAVPVAYIFAELLPREGGDLKFSLDVEIVGRPGELRPWIPDIGDWGYGVNVPGVRGRADWVQVFGASLPTTAWLPMKSPLLDVLAGPLDGAAVTLPAILATWPNGLRRAIEGGAYVILRTTGGSVEFRAEVPSDDPCGDDIKPPRVMPPRLRAAAAEFFNADGTPRFWPAHPKGC